MKSAQVRAELERRRLVSLRYVARDAAGSAPGGVPYPDNPNGSDLDAAGICDPTGRIFGLMPHPEAFTRAEHHPEWARGGARVGCGMAVFENGVRAARDFGARTP